MQMFRKPVQFIRQGDRAGICVAQLDAASIERGLAAKPRSMKSSDMFLAVVKRVPYYTSEIKTKVKLHISMGHQTATGSATFFSCALEAIGNQHEFN
jgi:selenocysteine-specific elongation factor